MKILKFFIIVCCICLLDACEDKDQHEGKKPAPIVEYTITPIHGGATITYSIPKDPEILYVMAEYERNGKSYTERSSNQKNSITIEGFNSFDRVESTLYTVSRGNEIKSDPLKVEFVPLESLVSLIRRSTDITIGFGGIVASWENKSNTELMVRLMTIEGKELVDKDIYFSSRPSEKHAFRGFEDVETTFILTYEDKWGNISDPVLFTGTPLFEAEVAKPWVDMRTMFPYDNATDLPGFPFSTIWDGSTGLWNRYLSNYGSAGSSFSFDLGQAVKLSRMIMWPRHLDPIGLTNTIDAVYMQVHILEFEMWGTKTLDMSKLGDLPYWLHRFSAAQTGQELPDHTFMDDWVYLGRYAVERLDLQGASPEDIQTQAIAGHHFDIPLECEPVRYIRFFPIATWDGSPPPNNYWQIGELSFFGDTKVPQD